MSVFGQIALRDIGIDRWNAEIGARPSNGGRGRREIAAMVFAALWNVVSRGSLIDKAAIDAHLRSGGGAIILCPQIMMIWVMV